MYEVLQVYVEWVVMFAVISISIGTIMTTTATTSCSIYSWCVVDQRYKLIELKLFDILFELSDVFGGCDTSRVQWQQKLCHSFFRVVEDQCTNNLQLTNEPSKLIESEIQI